MKKPNWIKEVGGAAWAGWLCWCRVGETVLFDKETEWTSEAMRG